MSATDSLLARYATEIDERQKFIDSLVEAAEKDRRDLKPEEMELVTRARDRVGELSVQLEPLKEARRISVESSKQLAELADLTAGTENPDGDRPPAGKLRYRTAGEYVVDYWRARTGQEDAMRRIQTYDRAAAHQTTADNPGLLPEQIVGPVVNFIDATRPLVSALGPRQLPSGSWSRPKITQHTSTGAQTAEKTELVSQKMVIGKVPVSAMTIGGYVNVSRQDVDWSQPAIMDIVLNDLAAQYAIDTEIEAANEFVAAAPAGPTLPTGTPDAADVTGALWGAAAAVMAGTAGQGRIFAVVPPELMGLIGPLFAPINPTNAQSGGFTTANLASGLAGSVAGIPIYVSGAMPNDTILVLSSAAAEVYEDRIGSLQVVEPSVLGVQVAYAGYFAALVMEANGLSKIVKTP